MSANDCTKESEKNSASTQTAAEGKDLELLTNRVENKPDIATTPAHNNKSWLALILVPTVALFLLPSMASHHLYRERNSLLHERDSVMRERDSVLREKDSLLVSVERLGEEVQSLKDEAERKKKEDAFHWDNCHQENSTEHEAVFIDNCWLSARASFQLRDCALDTKEKAKERAFALSSNLLGGWGQLWNSTAGNHWNADPPPYNDSSTIDDVGELIAQMMCKVNLLGKKLWNGTSMKGNVHAKKRKDTNGNTSTNGSFFFETPSFFSRMEISGKAQWAHTVNDMKSALSTFFSPRDDVHAAPYSHRTPRTTKCTRPADALDDLVDGFTDILSAAGSLTAAAGDAVVAAAVEKATDLLDFDGSYLDELLEIATHAAREASLTRAAQN